MVKWFLDHGADPTLGPPRIRLPKSGLVSDTGYILERAACCSSISTFDLLLKRGARLDKSFALNEVAPKEDKIAMMEHLLELGVDVDKFRHSPYHSDQGMTLHRAIRFGRVQSVRFLLERGPHFKDSLSGCTPLEEAETSANPEIQELVRNAALQGSANPRT